MDDLKYGARYRELTEDHKFRRETYRYFVVSQDGMILYAKATNLEAAERTASFIPGSKVTDHE